MTVNPTPNYRLSRPDFNSMSWHDETNGNFTVIDALFKAVGLANVNGAWATGTAYLVGARVVDPVSGMTYQAAQAHTSGTTTIAADIAANPAWWSVVSTGVVVREAFATGVQYNVGDFVYQTSEYLAGIVKTQFVGGATLRVGIANLGVIYDIKAAMTTITGAVTQTGLDRTQTGLDRTQTGLDRVATGQDKVATAADRVQTGLDKVATAADRVQTGLDRVATGQDKTATAADRVQTGLDRTAASTSAGNALTSENNAAATLAGAIRKDIDQSAQSASAALKINILKNTLQTWEQIGPEIVISGLTNQILWTALAYRRIRVMGWLQGDTDSANLFAREGLGTIDTSNNYFRRAIYNSGTPTVDSNALNQTYMQLSAAAGITANREIQFEASFDRFNEAAGTLYMGKANTESNASVRDMALFTGIHNSGVACNVFALGMSSGSFNKGRVILEGMR